MERYLAFHAVALEGSFTRAAARLHRSQPAVSQAVSALEDELEQRLFTRQGRKVELSHAGELLLPHVEQALDALAKGRARVEGLKQLLGGKVRLCVSDTLAIHALPEVLRDYHRRYPEVELRLDNRSSGSVLTQVYRRRAELGLSTRADERLHCEPLSPIEDVVICPPDHAFVGQRAVGIKALAAEPLLLLDDSSELRRLLEAMLRKAEVKARVTMELASVEVIAPMVAAGLGVSLVPRFAVRRELEAGRLHALPLRGLSRRPLFAVRRRRPQLPPAAAVLERALIEALPPAQPLV
ncbi:MAG: LysR family transcriptional regulator [Myxococcales bacterium]|nr:LysR family transcriptional regulator [Myxococcales bacterium]